MNTDDVDGDSSDDASNVGELFVEIPDECKQPKPLLFAEPSAEIVKEIRDFVAETGQSHMWRGHTHTRPPVGARVKYRARFELPETFVRARKFLVCPVCRPNSRNFGKREGMIAWFPDEGVIRLIGPDCFAELNKEGHNEALDELAKREKREEEFRFLLSQRDQHRVALNVLKASQQVAEALDDFGARLRKTLTETLNIDLWPHVRSGELQVIEKFREFAPNPRDPTDMRFVDAERPIRYGSLDGYKLIDPRAKKYAAGFAVPIATLEEVLAVNNWSEHVDLLEDGARRTLVKDIGSAIEAARTLRALVVDRRTFISAVNLGTLRRWGLAEGCPRPVWGRREGAAIKIGSSETRSIRVNIPPTLDMDIPSADQINVSHPT